MTQAYFKKGRDNGSKIGKINVCRRKKDEKN